MEAQCQEEVTSGHSNGAILDISETEMLRLEAICRLCANHSEKIIGIYSEEGISNGLPIKMNLYLPVKVAEGDSLPLQCCWSCASTVLAWHELVVTSVEADRRLRELQIVSTDELQSTEDAKISSSPEHEVETETTAASLSAFYHQSSPTKSKNQRKKIPPSQTEVDLDILKTEDSFDDEDDDDVEIGSVFVSNCNSEEADEKKVIKLDEKVAEDKVIVERKKEIALKKNANENVEDTEEKISLEWPGKDDKVDVYNFVCQYCSSMYVNEDDIINHVKEKHSDKVDLINTDTLLPSLDKKEKRKHSKIDQDAVNEAKVIVEGRVYYNCKVCGKSLYSPYTYIWHMRIHTGERPYVCDLCGKQFRVSQGLVRHLRETHEGIKNFPCDICGRMFATRRNVEEHRRIHTNERPYICDLCGKSFKQKASLFVHNRSHTDFFPFRCSYCNQGFRTRPPLLIHVTRHTGEKPYPCDVCGRCFRIKYELKRHRLIHSDEKPFSCTDCGLSFRQKRKSVGKYQDGSGAHLEKFTQDTEQQELNSHSDVHECETCEVKFPTAALLSAHKMRGHKRRKRTDIDYNIFCDVCNKGFTRRFDMEKHRRSKHSDLENLKPEDDEQLKNFNEEVSCFPCKKCEEKFEKLSELKAHEKKLHGVLKLRRKQGDIVAEYFCDVCSKGFTRKHDMVKHRKKQHPNQEPLPDSLLSSKRDERANFLQAAKITGPDGETFYKCKICERVFRQSYNLMRHQTIHTGVRAYFCHICGKNYPSSNGLKRHINEHHYGVKKYACDVCGKRFAASATRNEHLNIHTDTRPFVCDICGKTFKQKASLHTHKLFHTNDFKFSCSVCDRKFRRSTELKVHTWLHTGHKPHKCHLCASSFRLKKDLRKHIRVHDKLNECVCTECGSVFSQQKYLNNHKRTHRSHKYVTVVPPTSFIAVKSEPVEPGD